MKKPFIFERFKYCLKGISYPLKSCSGFKLNEKYKDANHFVILEASFIYGMEEVFPNCKIKNKCRKHMRYLLEEKL